MILTGLFLWWPRGRKARGRAGSCGRVSAAASACFWRDMHAVTGLWVSIGAVFLIASGSALGKELGRLSQAECAS